jgi:uncharacterized membrane protein YqjE
MIRQNNGTDRSVQELFQDIGNSLVDIARSEILLGRLAIKEEVIRTAKASTSLGVGVVLSLYALGFLLLAAVYGLATQVAVWQASLLIGGAVGVIALIAIAVGKSKLKQAFAESENSIKNLANKEKAGWARTQNKLKDTLKSDGTVSATTSVS